MHHYQLTLRPAEVQSYVTSQFDYGNPIVTCIPDTALKRKELVQNCADHGIRHQFCTDFIGYLFKEQINFKFSVYVFKSF